MPAPLLDRHQVLTLVYQAKALGWTGLDDLERALEGARPLGLADVPIITDFLSTFLVSPAGDLFRPLIDNDPLQPSFASLFTDLRVGFDEEPFLAAVPTEARTFFISLEEALQDPARELEAKAFIEEAPQHVSGWVGAAQWNRQATRELLGLVASSRERLGEVLPSGLPSPLLLALNQNFEALVAEGAWAREETVLFLSGLGGSENSYPDRKILSELVAKILDEEALYGETEVRFLALRGYAPDWFVTNNNQLYVDTVVHLSNRGLLSTELLRDMLKTPAFVDILAQEKIQAALMNSGLFGSQEISILLAHPPQNLSEWGKIVRLLIPHWRENGLWLPEHSQALYNIFWQALRHRRTPVQRAYETYVSFLYEAALRGDLPELDLDQLFTTAIANIDTGSEVRYSQINALLPVAPESLAFIRPGDPYATVQAYVGGKGAGLGLAARAGLPIPPYFFISVGRWQAVSEMPAEGLAYLEEVSGKQLGSEQNPLLVSVRSGMPLSFPGAMTTILNVGMNEASFRGLERLYGRPAALKAKLLFLKSYLAGVFDVDKEKLEALVQNKNLERAITALEVFAREQRLVIPEDPAAQLQAAGDAVHRSWLRFMEQSGPEYLLAGSLDPIIPISAAPLKTAIGVCEMKFGDHDISPLESGTGESGTGIALSHSLETGGHQVVLDYRRGASGVEIATPLPGQERRDALPEVYQQQLKIILDQLIMIYGGPVQVEFTIEDGVLWILQVRRLAASPTILYIINHDLWTEGIISDRLARHRDLRLPEEILVPAGNGDSHPVATSLITSGHHFHGQVVEDLAAARTRAESGLPTVYLIQERLTPLEVFRLPSQNFGLVLQRHHVIGAGLGHFLDALRNHGIPYVVVDDVSPLTPGQVFSFLADGSIFAGTPTFENIPIHQEAERWVRRQLGQVLLEQQMRVATTQPHRYSDVVLEAQIATLQENLRTLIQAANWIGFVNAPTATAQLMALHLTASQTLPPFESYDEREAEAIYACLFRIQQAIWELGQIYLYPHFEGPILERLRLDLETLQALLQKLPPPSPPEEVSEGVTAGNKDSPLFQALMWIDAQDPLPGVNLSALFDQIIREDELPPSLDWSYFFESLPGRMALVLAERMGVESSGVEAVLQARFRRAYAVLHADQGPVPPSMAVTGAVPVVGASSQAVTGAVETVVQGGRIVVPAIP